MAIRSAYFAVEFDPGSVRAAVRQLTAAFNRAHWRSYFAGGWRNPMPQLTTGPACICSDAPDVWCLVDLHAREAMARELLLVGCTCRVAPGWYPGRPAADGCPVHKPHRCNVAMLGRSWRSEGCGWRCPKCGAEWTLSIVHKLYEEHRTPYGIHPRSQCGPALCELLPPRPTMEWVRDEVTG